MLGNPGNRDCGKYQRRLVQGRSRGQKRRPRRGSSTSGARRARTARGGRTRDDGDFPGQRASPGVPLFIGSEERAGGLRGTLTCIYLHRKDNKRLAAGAGRVRGAGAAPAPGPGLGPCPSGPGRSYRPCRTAEWLPGWGFWSPPHRGWWGCWGHDPGAEPPFF